MDIKEIIKSRRSIRLFQQKPISLETLREYIDCARLAPAAANILVLEYIAVNEPEVCEQIFLHTAWAANVKPKRNPPEGKRPVAYIVVVNKVDKKAEKLAAVDAAAAIENILLASWADGIGTCWLGAINREEIAKILNVPADYYIDSVVAMGYPDETPVAVEAGEDTKYFLDDTDTLNVPKYPLDKITHEQKF